MSDYTKQLAKENANLEIEIQKIGNELRIHDRTNDYYSQDEVMIVYINKMLTILLHSVSKVNLSPYQSLDLHSRNNRFR